ncbi:uncharacterized protein [Palaemon carinicauda]|uniref:uncharacterized protein isoform X2 n=1 Tax=Palaemon carinicauda TaxID=392227 RepID=UPI0035B60696
MSAEVNGTTNGHSLSEDRQRRNSLDFRRPQMSSQNGVITLNSDSDIPKSVNLRRAKSLSSGRREPHPKRYSLVNLESSSHNGYDAHIDVSALNGRSCSQPVSYKIPEDEEEDVDSTTSPADEGLFNTVTLKRNLAQSFRKVRSFSRRDSDPDRERKWSRNNNNGAPTFVQFQDDRGDWQKHSIRRGSKFEPYDLSFKNKVVTVDGSKVKLQIWDTAGQERFRSVTHAYYRDAHALLLLYDVTSKNSFDNTRAWLAEVHEYAQDDVVIMLIGNKCDVNGDRIIRREDGERLAREYNVAFMETSAKTGLNVDLSFMAVARELKARKSNNPSDRKFNVADYVRQEARGESCNCNVG